MRQDPDVILIGEMRDPETVHAALAAAKTGHTVMSTLHTTDAAETINRVIDFFPPSEQTQVRLDMAKSLKGVVCQRLVKHVDGVSRVCVMEVMVNTNRIADAIADPSKTADITDLIKEGHYYGMQTFDQHLEHLVLHQVVDDVERERHIGLGFGRQLRGEEELPGPVAGEPASATLDRLWRHIGPQVPGIFGEPQLGAVSTPELQHVRDAVLFHEPVQDGGLELRQPAV